MFSAIRRLSKSKVGTIVAALFLLAILAMFAVGDIANLRSGNAGLSSSTLASAGGEDVTDRDMSQTMERALQQVRQQNPEADYSAVAGQFDPLLAALIDARALASFAADHGFHLSKRLIDAEIANIPAARGLNGQFNEQSYQAFLQQARLTDQQVREVISGDLLQELMLTPIATNARVPVGVARPYASMLLEARQGDVATIPSSVFRAGLNPTAADLQQFYTENRSRYIVPEQRVLRIARIGPEQVSGVTASEQEIVAYYNANQATYGARETRTLSQAVVPDQNVANQIATRARAGGAFAAAAAPAGLAAADVALGEQTKAQLAGVAGNSIANAVFGAGSGAIIGPLRSDLGWHVIKVEGIRSEGGKTLAAARAEIGAKLIDEKRKNALTDLVTRVEDALEDGGSFSDVANASKLPVTETPLITATGAARNDPAFRLPPDLAPALSAGFELAANDDPVVEALPNEAGYLLVAPGQIVPAAPAPLASIRDRVAADWIARQSLDRARKVATEIAAKTARNIPLAQAVREAGLSLPPVRGIGARRLQLSELGGRVPPPLQMLFTLGQGRSRMVAEPQGQGYFVVKVNRIVPGNAQTQPSLIGQVSREFQSAITEEYAQQFLAAVRADVGVKRNESAIAAAKRRIFGGGS